jgi:hypothetical protein
MGGPSDNDFGEWPIELRLLFSALPVGLFFGVMFFGVRVHCCGFGRGGHVLLSRWEGRIVVSAFDFLYLGRMWAGAKILPEILDLWFRIRHPGQIQSLFGDS